MRHRVASSKARSFDLKPWAISLMATGLVIAGVSLARAQDQEIITAYGYSTFGELKYKADMAHFDYVNPDAPKGGEISIWAQGTFDTFNPYSSKGVAAALSSIAFESLMIGTADEVSAIYCHLCESLEYPKDESWVIFHLRKDVKFSDGTPMTAQDVVFSHFKLLDEGLPSYAEAVRPLIPQAEALDDYTVKFTFGADVPKKNLITQAGGITVWSKAWFEKTGQKLNETSTEMPLGTAAYVLDSFDIGKQIVYKRNPDYWGAQHPTQIGRNNFDKIRVEYFADSEAALEGFSAGIYTFRQENSSLVWASRYDFPAVEKGWVKRETPENLNLPGANGIVYNLRREKLQDKRVRQALGLMFNFSWTNETLQYGLFKQRESFWQGSDLEAKGKPEGREMELLTGLKDMLDPAILTEDVVMPHVSDGTRQLDRKNLRTATALLEEAGWTVGDDGLLRNAKGETLDIEFLSASPNLDRIVTPYIENLKQLGVNAIYNRIDPAQFGERSRTFDYDVVYDGYTNGLEEGVGLTQRYGAESVKDVFNPAGYSSPAVEALAKAVVDAKTTEEMAAAVRAIDRVLRFDYLMTPTWYNGNYLTAYYDMFEHPDPLPPYALGYLDFWWYNADKAAALKAAGALK